MGAFIWQNTVYDIRLLVLRQDSGVVSSGRYKTVEVWLREASLFHDQDAIHAEKGCADMPDFRMVV